MVLGLPADTSQQTELQATRLSCLDCQESEPGRIRRRLQSTLTFLSMGEKSLLDGDST